MFYSFFDPFNTYILYFGIFWREKNTIWFVVYDWWARAHCVIFQEWLDMKAEQGLKAEYVWNKEKLGEVDISETDHLMGKTA